MDDLDPIALEIKKEQEAGALKRNLSTAMDTNPDKQAEVNRLSAKSGVPAFSIASPENEAWVKNLTRMKDIDPDGMVNTHPMTAKAFNDENFARIAHDDVENLKEIEDVFSAIGKDQGSTVSEFLGNLGISALNALPRTISGASGVLEVASAGAGLPDGVTRKLSSLRKDYGYMADEISQNIQDRAGGYFEGMAYGAAESIGVTGLSLGATLVTGNPAVGLGIMGSTVGGGSAGQALDKGYSPLAAGAFGAAQGGIEIATEKIPFMSFLGDLKAGSGFLKTIGNQIISEVPGEQVATFAQGLLDWAVLNPEEPFSEYVKTIPKAQADTFVQTVMAVGAQSTAGSAIISAQKRLENLRKLDVAVKKSKTVQRDPAAVRAMVEASLPDSRVYVDGGVATTYYQELDPEAKRLLAEAIPDIEERIQEASVSGGDVILNRSDYVAYIAPYDAGGVLMEHVKFDRPDDITVAQLSDPDYLQSLYDMVPEQNQGRTDIEAFQDRIVNDLRDSGRVGTTQIARESVAPLAAMIQTMRERGGSEAVTQSLLRGIQVQGPAKPPAKAFDPTDAKINDMREYAAKATSIFRAQDARRTKAKEKAMVEGRVYKEPKTRGKSRNLPVLKFLNSRGGVLIGSPLAAELKVMDVTPKNAPWLFRKQDGKIATAQGVQTIKALSDLDTFSADEVNAAIGTDIFQNTGTDVTDTQGNYVDPGDLLAAIDSELRGAPVVDKPVDDTEAAYEDFTRYLSELGLDLETATNEQIKQALNDPASFLGTDPTLDAEVDADGVTYNQSGEIVTDTKAFKDWFGDSKVVDENGKPLVVYHGTTHNIESFNKERANIENDLGAGYYFTNNQDEVSENYAGEGPDLTQRIELLAERIDGEEEIGMEEARARARKELSGGVPNVIPAYLSMKNPVQIGGQDETFFTYESEYNEDNEEYSEPTGTLVNFIDGLNNAAASYDDADVEAAVGLIYEYAMNEGGISATELINLLKGEPGGLLYSTDENGNLAGNEIIRASFEDAGYDGIIDHTVNEKFGSQRSRGKQMAGMDENTVHYIAFQPEQIKSTFNRGTFDPNDPRILNQKNRGQVSIMNDGRYVIKLFETSNLSTFLHETGHIFLEAMNRYATAEDSPQEFKDNMAAILDYLGVKSFSDIEVKHHEKFARAFENYLMTGEAPSVGLQSSFQKFKAWLTRIYQSALGLNAPITPELKAVFDRMLATDEEIAQVQSQSEGFNINKDLIAILPKADQERYERLHNNALEQAKENLLKKTLKQKERETTKWWKDERAKVRAEMESQVHSDPVYRAIEFLTKGKYLPGDEWVEMPPVKISRADAQKVIGKTIMADMPRGMFGRSGITADHFAEMIGYNVGNGQNGYRRGSGSELLYAIANAEDRKARIERLTNEAMVDRHGDLLTDGTIEKAALEAFHSDAQALKMEMEGKAAAKLAGLPFGSNTNFELAAQKILASKNIRDATNVDRFYVASVRASKAYGKALRSKNYGVAVKAKQQQLLSHHLYKQAIAARRTLEKSIKAWDRLKKPDEKLSKSMDMNYVYVARAILGRYGVLPYNAGNLQIYFAYIRETDPEAFEDLVLVVEENTRAVPEAKTRGNGTYQPWTQLSLEEFLGLKDTIDNVLGVGRNQKTMTIDGEKIERETILKELQGRIDELPPTSIADGAQKALEWHDRGKLALSGIRAGLRRVENWTNVMDGKYGGVFRKYIWNPINDARGQYQVAKHEYLDKMVELLQPHDENLNGSGKIEGYEIGYTFHSKAELVGMMLHMGNESNWDKLWRGARGAGSWNPANLQSMLDRMMRDGTITKDDMDLLQGMWNLVKTLKPQAQKAHKAMYGYYFSEITSWPIQTPWGEYEGGYWPAIADNALSQDARIRQDKEDLIMVNNSSMFPTTGRGFTKGRVENYAAPLSFDLKLLPSHVDKVLRFVHLEPAVKDVAKLVNDRGFRKAMEVVDPRAIEDMIIPWLQRVARQTVETNDSKWFKHIDPASRWLRSSASAQAMMLNMLNAMQQITGFAPAMYKLGPRNMGRALVQYMKNPMKAHAMIYEASSFMRYRNTILADNMQKAVIDVVLDTSKYKKVKDAAHAHGYIFQKIFQSWVDGTTWMAAYDKATADGMNEKDAVRYADSMVRETQGSTSAEDLSKVEAGPATMRLFTMFYSYFNSQANLITTEAQNIVRSTNGLDRTRKLGYLYLMTFAVPSFMAEMIVRGMKGDLPDDDDDDGSELDDWLAWFVGSQVRFGTAMVPWVGQVINGTVNAFDDKPYNDRLSLSPVIGMAETLAKTPKSIYDAVADDGDVSRAIQNTLTSLGFVTGLPLGQLGKPLGYAADVAEGDTEIDNPLDPIRGMLAGPPPADKR